jgi:hypothetical protein
MQTSQRMFMGVFVHVYIRCWKTFVVKILARRLKYLLQLNENSTEILMLTFV